MPAVLRPAALGALLLLVGCNRKVVVAVPPGSSGTGAAQTITISDGESLIRAMHARYDGKWYRTATFSQRTTTVVGAGRAPTVQTWYETMSLPGKLRIDVNDPAAGNGFLYRADSVYQMSGGRVATATRGFNPLLLLGFDVYTQPPEQTISVLRYLGFQLSRMRTDNFEGKPVYVVGAASRNDTTSKQFWIERDRLVFVRSLEKNARGQEEEYRFTNYVRANQGWIAKEVWQVIDGEGRVHEEYSTVTFDPVIDPALFDPRQWSTAKHWVK